MDRRSFCLVTGGAAALAACRRQRHTAFPGYAFVANEEGQSVAVVDLTAFAVVKHIRLDGNPTGVVKHPRKPAIYVLTPNNGAVHEIGADSLALSRSLRVAAGALSMRLAPDGEALYILSRNPNEVVCVSPAGMRVRWRVPLAAEGTDFDVAPNGETLAVSYGNAGSIGFIGVSEHGPRTSRPVQVSQAVGTLRFQSDSSALMVANTSERMLSIYEVASHGLIVHLPLALRPDQLCFSLDGGQLFITGEGMDAVVVVFPYHTPQIAETVLAGHAPGVMAACENPNYLFVANPQSGNVSILSIETRKVIAVTQVGSVPRYIAITPNNQYALVLNAQSGDVAVIRIPAIKGNRWKSGAALFTMIPVGSKPVSAVVREI